MTASCRILLVSIVPPRNDCGVRIVMHRMFMERSPFELHVASNADFANDLLVHTPLRLPGPLHRLRKSRFGPRLAAWITDYENFVWPLTTNAALETAVETFKPDVILTLAECGLCHGARKTAERHGLPLAGLFLDWFPVMKGHFGHEFTQTTLSRRYRELYSACDLAFCTSDGMQEVLGLHPNSHVIYPMPGRHSVPEEPWPPSNKKFRLVYVGSVENFYGRMLCSLIEKMEPTKDLEIIVVGPNADWPLDVLNRAKANGIYLGFKSPEQAADVMASADALLVVMSFEKEHELFMRTSFTTKFLDYVAFGKPVILWGPDYCTPVRVARKHGGAVVVNQDDADAIVSACRQIAHDAAWREQLSHEATRLHQTLFDPDRLQKIFVSEIEKLLQPRTT
ncbi:MAG TPA: glycosyltransferase family 4 protein [Candidatus Limnocylindria bacterium]|nr:glycosyltransferase family 4 protein [Candidatus Limnocylindria bacterium]